jgi:hypothetical protein
MNDFPFLVRSASSLGKVRYRPGHPLIDRYLEFVAGRAVVGVLEVCAYQRLVLFEPRCLRGEQVAPRSGGRR